MNNILKISLAVTVFSLAAVSSRGQVVIGSWQTGSDEGWLGANGLSITDPSNTGIYSFVNAGVPGYAQSLQITKSGFGGVLQDKLEYHSGEIAAFLNNHILSFTFSVPASASTAGYNQIYALNINASGYGYNNVGNGGSWPGFTAVGNTNNNSSGGQPNYYYYNNPPSGLPLRTQTVSFDYSSILPLITATPSSGYIELTFTFNNDGAAADSMGAHEQCGAVGWGRAGAGGRAFAAGGWRVRVVFGAAARQALRLESGREVTVFPKPRASSRGFLFVGPGRALCDAGSCGSAHPCPRRRGQRDTVITRRNPIHRLESAGEIKRVVVANQAGNLLYPERRSFEEFASPLHPRADQKIIGRITGGALEE